MINNILKHSARWHAFVSRNIPIHLLPPFSGAGFSQRRHRLWNPLPHVFEHWLHALHSVHPPSICPTVKIIYQSINKLINIAHFFASEVVVYISKTMTLLIRLKKITRFFKGFKRIDSEISLNFLRMKKKILKLSHIGFRANLFMRSVRQTACRTSYGQ